MNKVIALTGTSGAMGGEVLLSLMQSDKDLKVRCILFDKEKRIPKFVKKTLKKYCKRIFWFKGDIARYDDCVKLLDGADYVINCASIIPPKSDHDPDGTYKSNYLGTKNIVDAILASERADEIAYVHIATVALYGHRAYPHLWIRVGDPIIPSDYDVYSLHKLKAEKYVLESGLKRFVSLRQTAILHKYLFNNNLKDGLMFHTVWNGTLEWASDKDSGRLIKNLVEKDLDGKLDGFWNKIYNIGGGAGCRVTGFESIDGGFALTGNSAKKYFKPNWNITRNFHGGWFYDSDELENILHFRSETNEMFWNRMGKKYRYFKLAKIVPSSLISKLAIQRLFKNTNAPMYWLKHNKEGRIRAFFKSREDYEKLPYKWENFHLLCEGKLENGETVDYEKLKDVSSAAPLLLDHGYDDKKPESEWTIEDLKSAAAFRGGKCISTEYGGDPHEKVLWECKNRHKFALTPYTVLKGGYFCHCCEPKPWRYGAFAGAPFLGQVYFDSHDKSETQNEYPLNDHEEDFLKR